MLNEDILKKYQDKIEFDICALTVDLEYFKAQESKNKIIKINNGGEIDKENLIKGIKQGIENLNTKLEVIKKLYEN